MTSVMELLTYLQEHDIHFSLHEHPPVYTVGEARLHLSAVEGVGTKNLFLRDKKGEHYVLVVAYEKTVVDLKALSSRLNRGRLSFASPERLKKVLGVEPGSVSLLALINDVVNQVEVVIDRQVWEATALQAHPLVNTRTLVINQEGIRRFLELMRCAPLVLDLDSEGYQSELSSE